MSDIKIKAPWHLWLIGVVAVLFNSIGAFDPCDEHDLWQHLYGQCGHDAGADRTLSRATELNDGSLGDWGVRRDVEFSAHSAAQ
jgi:hypothetical protein